MSDPILIVLGLVAAAAAAVVVWRAFGGSQDVDTQADYRHALELWIEGDLESAAALLKRVVQAAPDTVEPFLYLGVLLRLRGDAAKAAVLHRGLTVRSTLTQEQKIAVGLALADDLLELKRWPDAAQVLESLQNVARGRKRYWLARFRLKVGQQDLPNAARALKHAPRHCPEKDSDELRASYAAFQLDRALLHALAGETGEARARLRDVEKIPDAAARAALVRAILAAHEDDPAAAVTEAAENLLDQPHELGIVLPLLQEALLRGGQFARTIPILERACQAENAPPSLWIQLALLYEKLDQRDRALQLLEAKADQGVLTPDVAAPFLRRLVRQAGKTDFARAWATLSPPKAPTTWACCDCGRGDKHIRWYCPGCGGFDTYRLGCRKREDA